MIYTEDEAKTKECRAIPPTLNAVSSTYDLPGHATTILKCSASACMLWESVEPEMEVSWIAERQMTPPQPPAGPGWRLAARDTRVCWVRDKSPRGYCGLLKR